MTYVSRRARITVPRWPNEFDPEFLFRVGRRCDGRLKRHSSCHDLRAWINDNCIKNEYLLDLMSDGEVILRPPLQLYGRFIPVPLLFKLLQNSRSANEAEPTDWEKALQGKGSQSTSEDRSKGSASVVTYEESSGKEQGPGVSFRFRRASYESDVKAQALEAPSEDDDSKWREPGTSYEDDDSKWREPGTSYEDDDSKWREPGTSYENDERKWREPGTSYEKDESKRKEPGVSYEDDDSRGQGSGTFYQPSGSKGQGSRIRFSEKGSKGTRWKSSVGLEENDPQDEENIYGVICGEGAGAATTAENQKRKRWDPFEKMEYYTSGFASKGAIVDGVEPFPSSTHSSLAKDDDNTSKKSNTLKSESETSLTKVLWEKDLIEKNLFKSTSLLSRALGKLEKIDSIIQLGNEETENLRKGEIQEAFRKPKFSCIKVRCISNTPERPTSSVKYRVQSARELVIKETQRRRNELQRQISDLREKLKKNQICRERLKAEIVMSHRRVECLPAPLKPQGQAQVRKLQKRMERLVNQREKVLWDMCQALIHLNNLKKYSSSRIILRKRCRSDESRVHDFRQEPFTCFCGHCQSSNSERARCSDSMSSSDDNIRRPEDNFNSDDAQNNYDYSSADNYNLGRQNVRGVSRTKTAETLRELYATHGELYKDHRQEKEGRKLSSADSPSRKQLDADLSFLEKYLRSQQHLANTEVLDSTPNYRPSTSPTTRKERRDASEERWGAPSVRNNPEIPQRRVKSETTMKEIEKTLRNYEQRLKDMDGLEYKVEEWKKKLLEACRWKRNASKIESEMQKSLENEKNRTSREINGLFSENCELKKQVRQLMDRSKEQAKKIQNMKSTMMKAKDLESEAEELKKELSEYRNCYEHQRKCINKWESVVAVQRKEIENLMNHIRKLTTEKSKEQTISYYQDRRCVLRTRSHSPDSLTECQDHSNRPQTYNLNSDDGNGSCCCQEFRQSESRRSHLRCFGKNCYNSATEREDWCN